MNYSLRDQPHGDMEPAKTMGKHEENELRLPEDINENSASCSNKEGRDFLASVSNRNEDVLRQPHLQDHHDKDEHEQPQEEDGTELSCSPVENEVEHCIPLNSTTNLKIRTWNSNDEAEDLIVTDNMKASAGSMWLSQDHDEHHGLVGEQQSSTRRAGIPLLAQPPAAPPTNDFVALDNDEAHNFLQDDFSTIGSNTNDTDAWHPERHHQLRHLHHHYYQNNSRERNNGEDMAPGPDAHKPPSSECHPYTNGDHSSSLYQQYLPSPSSPHKNCDHQQHYIPSSFHPRPPPISASSSSYHHPHFQEYRPYQQPQQQDRNFQERDERRNEHHEHRQQSIFRQYLHNLNSSFDENNREFPSLHHERGGLSARQESNGMTRQYHHHHHHHHGDSLNYSNSHYNHTAYGGCYHDDCSHNPMPPLQSGNTSPRHPSSAPLATHQNMPPPQHSSYLQTSNGPSSAALAAPSHTTTNVGQLLPYYSRRVLPLATSEDENWLSEFLCFVRCECIEVFKATTDDVAVRMNSKKVLKDQVGFRCRFCAHLPARERTGRSSSFPSSIDRIYQSLTMMIRDHFPNCHAMPPELKERYLSLKANSSQGATDSKRYWIDSGKSSFISYLHYDNVL